MIVPIASTGSGVSSLIKVARLQLLTTRIRTDCYRRLRVDPSPMPRSLNLPVDGE